MGWRRLPFRSGEGTLMWNRVLHTLRSQAARPQKQRRWVRWIGQGLARVSYAYWVEPTWLELNSLSIRIRDLPAAFRGLRIAQLSDFHCGRQVTASYIGEAIQLAHGQSPDVIVLTGDFIHRGFRHVETVARALADCRAPLGVYAVLGNHDFSVRNALGFRRFRHLHRSVASALTANGIRVLKNEAIALTRAHDSIYLVGVDDLWSRECDLTRAFEQVPAASPAIVLAHNPRTVEQLEGRRCDLMLSGHTHGGQIHLPVLGRPTLSKKARRFAAGLYEHEGSQLYVNKGVGFGFRIRYGVRPEVAILTLQSDSEA